MKASNLKSFALGFGIAISALGLYALAATLNTFKAGDVVSAQLINDNFTNLNTDVATANSGVTTLNTKVTALETKKTLTARGGLYAYSLVNSAGEPDAGFSFNPLGTITVTDFGTGLKRITFAGASADFASDAFIRHVQVSGYGANTNSCKVDSWNGTDVFVRCFTAAGALVNNGFTVQISN